jgi:hypothetical protein
VSDVTDLAAVRERYDAEEARDLAGADVVLARVVAEALLAWRRDPTPASWDRLMATGHAYEQATRNPTEGT